ncbi:MAG: GIY-YIG nuclease family protein [Candidatus Omnitrophica bacterium]|nr:GIY-YIG nuclease family protein [Candidatus Omnitrophota bacterium]
MYYTYILECNNGNKYYGHTNNLAQRLRDHTRGKVFSTRNKQPKLVYYKEFNSCSEAFKREMQFKNGKTRKKTIERLIKSFPKAKCQGFNSQTLLERKRWTL